jgi:aspartate 1-decarboxylase
MLKGKIHRATVTGADLHYEGSITIDRELMEAANILPYEEVRIYNVTNGERFETYAIEGEPGGGEICLNGAAAHKASRGDIVIIACFGLVAEEQARGWKPDNVYVDAANRIAVRSAGRLVA